MIGRRGARRAAIDRRVLAAVLLAAGAGAPAAGGGRSEEPAARAATAAPEDAAPTETTVEVPAGSELRPRPEWRAPVAAVLPGGPMPLVAIGVGDWVEVRHGDGTGWVRLGDPAGWPGRGPAALARARRRLGAAAVAARTLGPFAAASDLPDGGLWRALGRLAGALPALWSERYGTSPGEGAETVVVFAREEDYRACAPPAAEGLAGHAGSGIVLLYLGDRGRTEIGATLVHELAHLLNRRAFGRGAPPWLDEGIAEDLALARIDGNGRLSAAPLTRRSVHTGSRIDLYGPLVALGELVAALEAGALPPLPGALALDRDAFLAAPDRRRLYAYYGFWVRYLIEGEGGAHRDRFRAFLAAAAGGDRLPPATGDAKAETEALAAALGRSWPELEAGYHGWLRGLPRRLELPVQ